MKIARLGEISRTRSTLVRTVSRGRRPSSDAAPGSRFSVRWTRWPSGLGRCAGGSSGETPQRLVLPQQFQALEQTRRDLRAGHRNANRLERLARRELEPLGQGTEGCLDLRSGKRLDALELVMRGGHDWRTAVQQRWIGFDLPEEEACEVGELSEALDLLLHDRRGTTDERLVPVVTLVAQKAHELVGVRFRS